MTWTTRLSRRSTLKAGAAGMTVAALGAAPFTALAQEATPAGTCPSTTPEQNIALAKRWFTDLPQGLNDLITPDFTIEHGMGADLTTRQDVLNRLQAIATAVPHSTHEYELTLTQDDYVVLRWHGDGTFSAPYLGHPPTGEPVHLSGIHIFHITCGKINQIWAETNLFEVHLQLLGQAAPATPVATPAS